MRMYDIILRKRNGGTLSSEEIRFFLQGFVAGTIPDYQVSALMMAIYFQGMDPEETQVLVDEMVHSGEVMDLSAIHGIKVDKHSTGGVGDKTSIVLAPLVAAAGVPVAKLSGRGLGHTGGTLDKLESFPGFSSSLSSDDFIRNVNEIGIAIAGQTANLVPADKKLYALRDVTATVENFSLIAGSIMSKKLAGGADAIILDVKCGDGAFMKDLASARELAQAMVTIGNKAGKKTEAIISSMEQPLGYAVGNALEVQEAIATLRGEGPEDLTELCLALGSRMLVLGGKATSESDAGKMLEELIQSGNALKKLAELVHRQGGNAEYVFEPASMPRAKFTGEVVTDQEGFINQIKAGDIGIASMVTGAGRSSKEDVLDLGAGIILEKKVGAPVKKGESLARVYASSEEKLQNAVRKASSAFVITSKPPVANPLILDRLN